MTKETKLNIRVSPDMKARIQAAADASDVSVSAWVLTAISMRMKEETMNKTDELMFVTRIRNAFLRADRDEREHSVGTRAWHEDDKLTILTSASRNPALSRNGGDYDYFLVVERDNGGIRVFDDWSSDIDREQFLGEAKTYHIPFPRALEIFEFMRENSGNV